MRLQLPCRTVLAVSLALAAVPALSADPPGPILSQGFRFTEQTGDSLYANACQACHMSKGEGAVGAARYPALASNEKLKAGGYPVNAVLHGQKAMPPFGRMMSDEQIAAVVNYIRTHFGNKYRDGVTAQDVKNAR
jgi:mono/diheme cytochrome c family protein